MSYRQDNETDAIFVDLANFYTRLTETKLAAEDWLVKYFTDWFDFSTLARFLTGGLCDVWVFHGDGNLGPERSRITDIPFHKLISRFNRQEGVTAQNVNIKGKQREPATIKCKKCDSINKISWQSEKGIDTSLIVHLFDTSEAWNTSYIVSGDADFVPAVRSLRRKGKVVNGAGVLSQASPALIRECYKYVDLQEFLRMDLSLFDVFGDGGILSQLLPGFIRDQPLLEHGQEKKDRVYDFHLTISESLIHDQIAIQISCPLLDFDKLTPLVKNLALDQFLDGRSIYQITLRSYGYGLLNAKFLDYAKKNRLTVRKTADGIEEQGYGYVGHLIWDQKKSKYVRDYSD